MKKQAILALFCLLLSFAAQAQADGDSTKNWRWAWNVSVAGHTSVVDEIMGVIPELGFGCYFDSGDYVGLQIGDDIHLHFGEDQERLWSRSRLFRFGAQYVHSFGQRTNRPYAEAVAGWYLTDKDWRERYGLNGRRLYPFVGLGGGYSFGFDRSALRIGAFVEMYEIDLPLVGLRLAWAFPR